MSDTLIKLTEYVDAAASLAEQVQQAMWGNDDGLEDALARFIKATSKFQPFIDELHSKGSTLQ